MARINHAIDPVNHLKMILAYSKMEKIYEDCA